ncbi:class I SAM-dependent methyltransferase [Candidatus Electronema sp. JC]|uniref:class I SAM-dependent methyltransferase n=1 Tax=Candidatus Electronema sp. JC TaxID=3401570 RepID=UPI003B43C0EB
MTKAEKQKKFWEKMAERYPAPFSEESLEKTGKVISMAEQRGVRIDGAAVLDIGCGTGIYTLPLAKRAARVTGLDLSEGMLLRLEAERQQHGLENVTTVQGPWSDEAVAKHGLEKAFDIVWAAMTPAVRTVEDVARMNRCSRRWCVYSGWGELRRNPLMEAAFQAHGLNFGPPPGAKAVQAALAGMGIRVAIETVRRTWDWEGTVEEAFEHVEGFIESQSDVEPQPELIREVIARFTAEDGKVRHQTEMEMGMMVWETA